MGLVAAYTMAGAAKGMLDVLEMNERERLREAALAAQEQMNIRAEERAHQRKLSDLDDQRARSVQYRQEDAQSVTARAQEIADGERGLLLQGAESAYRNSGMSPQDVSTGLGAVDAARQAPADITREHRLRAARELGILGEKEAIGIELQQSKDERDDKRLEQQAARDALRTALQERRLDLDAKKIDAMIARMGSSNANVSAFVQNFDKIKRETGWDSNKVLDYMNAAKQRGDEWSQTEKTDPLTGEKVVETTRKGAGDPPHAGKHFVWKDGKLVPQ
jgi:hypothetical protein